MKKRLSILSGLMAFMLLLSGCGSSGGKSADTAANSKKTLNILTYANWNPFEYLDNGELVGFDVDLIKAVAKEAGYECEVKNAGWEELFTQIKNKTADVGISGITITDERKQTYDFSDPYFVSRQSILVKNDSDIKSGADLKNNKTVAVQNGSTGQESVEKLLGKNNDKIKKLKSGLTNMELIHNDCDSVVSDDTSNQEYIKNNANEDLKIIQDKEAFAPEYFGILYPKDSKLKEEFDKALNTLYDNGTYKELYMKWFKVEPNIDELKAQK